MKYAPPTAETARSAADHRAPTRAGGHRADRQGVAELPGGLESFLRGLGQCPAQREVQGGRNLASEPPHGRDGIVDVAGDGSLGRSRR